jgi:hypothetical protein
MRHPLIIRVILFFIVFCSLMISCSKDDNQEIPDKEEILTRLNNDINSDSLESVATWLQGMGTRFALADNRRFVAQKIKNRFIMIGYPDVKIDSFEINKDYHGITYDLWQYNVVATLEAGNTSDSVCIIGAHYDSITASGDPFTEAPGANDNASGIAAALEIARVMKNNNYVPSNTIMFVAFGSEELGLLGSLSFTNSSLTSQKVMFMLNNDMIAYEPGTDKSQWKVNILDYDNSSNLRNEAELLCNKYTILESYNDNTHSSQTDSYSFFVNGYKAICFTSDIMDPYYHSLNDNVSHCNFEYCREIVKLNCAILVERN